MPSRFASRAAAAALFLASGLALGGCQTVQDTLGIGKSPPNEMEVAPRRPLVVPPDYDLRAPQPGAPNRGDIDARGEALRALATAGQGVDEQPAPAPSDGTP